MILLLSKLFLHFVTFWKNGRRLFYASLLRYSLFRLLFLPYHWILMKLYLYQITYHLTFLKPLYFLLIFLALFWFEFWLITDRPARGHSAIAKTEWSSWFKGSDEAPLSFCVTAFILIQKVISQFFRCEKQKYLYLIQNSNWKEGSYKKSKKNFKIVT